jgi:hypothetical protein
VDVQDWGGCPFCCAAGTGTGAHPVPASPAFA